MGPQATVLLQQRLIDAVEVTDDADHIPLIVDMNPQVPSRLSWVLEGRGEDPGEVLVKMSQRLAAAGAKALAMPCNTAHHFASQISASVDIPFFNMVDMACQAASGVVGTGGKVGILASPATDRISLFQKSLGTYGTEPVYPDDQPAMLAAIRRMKAVGPREADISALTQAAENCRENGASCILVGCTEFSLVANAVEIDLPVIDTINILVERILAFSNIKSRELGSRPADRYTKGSNY